jgi:hypothetical protein
MVHRHNQRQISAGDEGRHAPLRQLPPGGEIPEAEMTRRDAFMYGAAAHKEGKRLAEIPFAVHTRPAVWWAEGWVAAHRQRIALLLCVARQVTARTAGASSWPSWGCE